MVFGNGVLDHFKEDRDSRPKTSSRIILPTENSTEKGCLHREPNQKADSSMIAYALRTNLVIRERAIRELWASTKINGQSGNIEANMGILGNKGGTYVLGVELTLVWIGISIGPG
ncbi:hypothetical protein R6Q57_022828 [Mikania cordata]